MRLKISLSLICFLSAIKVFSIDVIVNNHLYQQYHREQIEPLLYTVDPDDGTTRGISLDEILPPFYDAYSLTVKSTNGDITWSEGNLANSFSKGYLIIHDDAYSFSFDGRCVQDVVSIEILGEVIENRSLEVWVSWEGVRLLKKEIERYAELHNTDIRVTEVPKTSSKLISVLRGGGTPPDIIMVQSSDIPSLVLARALQQLGYIDTERFDRRGIEAFQTGNNLWGIPFYCDPQVVFINRKIISDPPPFNWTLKDLEDMSAILLRRGITPLAWNAYSASWLIPFQIAFGKDRLVEPDGSITINDRPSIEALDYVLSLQEAGYLKVLERDAMVSLFVSGKVAMIFSGSYSIPGFREIGLDFAVLPYPLHHDTGRPVAPLLDYKALAITRRTRHPVLSRRLIEYLTGFGVQQRFPSALSKLASNSGAAEISSNSTAYFSSLAESSARGIPIPPEKAYGVYKNTMWSLLRFAFTGQLTPEEVLKKGQDIINRKLTP